MSNKSKFKEIEKKGYDWEREIELGDSEEAEFYVSFDHPSLSSVPHIKHKCLAGDVDLHAVDNITPIIPMDDVCARHTEYLEDLYSLHSEVIDNLRDLAREEHTRRREEKEMKSHLGGQLKDLDLSIPDVVSEEVKEEYRRILQVRDYEKVEIELEMDEADRLCAIQQTEKDEENELKKVESHDWLMEQLQADSTWEHLLNEKAKGPIKKYNYEQVKLKEKGKPLYSYKSDFYRSLIKDEPRLKSFLQPVDAFLLERYLKSVERIYSSEILSATFGTCVVVKDSHSPNVPNSIILAVGPTEVQLSQSVIEDIVFHDVLAEPTKSRDELAREKGELARMAFENIVWAYGLEYTDKLKESLSEFGSRVSLLYFLGYGEKYLKYKFASCFCMIMSQGEYPKAPAFLVRNEKPGCFLTGAGYSFLNFIKREKQTDSRRRWACSVAKSILDLKYGCALPCYAFLQQGILDHKLGVCRQVVEDRTYELLRREFPKLNYDGLTIIAMSTQKARDIDDILSSIASGPWFHKHKADDQPYYSFVPRIPRNEDGTSPYEWLSPAQGPVLPKKRANVWDGVSQFVWDYPRKLDPTPCKIPPVFVPPSTSAHTVSLEGVVYDCLKGYCPVSEDENPESLPVNRGGSFFHLGPRIAEYYLADFRKIYLDKNWLPYKWDEECIQWTLYEWESWFLRGYHADACSPWEMCLPLPVRPVALAEELKVRVITLGPSNEYYRLMEVQRALHGHLRRFDAFSLIGFGKITAELLKSIFPIIPRSRKPVFFVSGDYKAATDNLEPALSLAVVNYISDVWNLSPDQKDYFKYALCGHEIQYGKSGASPSLYRATDSETLCQTHGQLMGSTVSFPVLCLANDACLRASAKEYLRWWAENPVLRGEDDTEEFRDYVSGVLQGKGYLINGDDILFLSSDKLYEIWNRMVRSAGLEPSVGKNYTSSEFCIINSSLFLVTLGEDLPFPDFTLVPWLNQSLLNNGVREKPAIINFNNDPTLKSIGSNAWELIRDVPWHETMGTELWVDKWISLYMKSWVPFLSEKVPTGLPYFVACQNGGLGLPVTRQVSLSKEQFKYCEYFSMNHLGIRGTNDFCRVKDAGVQDWIKQPRSERIGTLSELPGNGNMSEDVRWGFLRFFYWMKACASCSVFGDLAPDHWKRLQLAYKDRCRERINTEWQTVLQQHAPKSLEALQDDGVNCKGAVLPPDYRNLNDKVSEELRRNFMGQFPLLWSKSQRHSIKDVPNLTISNPQGRVCDVMWYMGTRTEWDRTLLGFHKKIWQ